MVGTYEGLRRLGLVLGWVGACLAGLFGFSLIQWTPTGLGILSLLIAAGFLIPWSSGAVLSWIIEGFVLDRSGPNFEKGRDAFARGKFRAALKHLRPLAEQGHALAQVYLGEMYDNGNGVSRDPNQAVRWFRSAAEKGEPWAQVLLAGMYSMGRGVDRPDEHKAMQWMAKAAEQGHTGAQFDLGCHYSMPSPEFVTHVRLNAMNESNIGMPKAWPLDLTMQMLAAQRELSKPYDGPKFIPQDEMTYSQRRIVNYVQAYKWFSLAATKRGADALRVSNFETNMDVMADAMARQAFVMRDGLRAILAPERLEDAERLISEWRPTRQSAAFLPLQPRGPTRSLKSKGDS